MLGPWEFTEAGLGPTPWLLRAFGFAQVKHLPWRKSGGGWGGVDDDTGMQCFWGGALLRRRQRPN